jgi:lipopolysaccharide/colanic/teichoic acid biosynthesis glycosyltransferase
MLGAYFAVALGFLVGNVILLTSTKEGQEEAAWWAVNDRTFDLVFWVFVLALAWPVTLVALVIKKVRG